MTKELQLLQQQSKLGSFNALKTPLRAFSM